MAEYDRHHAMVLHSVNKIEAMRRTDEALNRTITRLVDTVALQLASFSCPSTVAALATADRVARSRVTPRNEIVPV